ncbi:MAG: M1 family metallopeptidase, partial [Candidatus Cyclobacteriaceae bacterium M3_2C_046]
MIRLIFAILQLLIITVTATAQDIGGNWYGLISDAYPLQLNIKSPDPSAYHLNLHHEQVLNGPVAHLIYTDDSLMFTFSWKEDQYNFRGKVDHEANKIHGILTSDRFRDSLFILSRSSQAKKNIYHEHQKARTYNRQDSLRGMITRERAWWDLQYYHLQVKVNPEDSTLAGSNTIYYKVLDQHQILQIDLQPPLKIEQVWQDGKLLKFRRDQNVYFISLQKRQKPGDVNKLELHYQGQPRTAINPPWDGGISWQQDSLGNPFVASSCQGIGASVWWPNKDHMYDEVDSMLISINVPNQLTAVANGRLRNIANTGDGRQTYHWFVNNPINNYGVNINIGDYVHFAENYEGEKGILDCDYYVLRYNLKRAREQFKQVSLMLQAFEHWFGPYPFYEDGYKLVETPYLGMEHQSSVTYGNQFQNGYLGQDFSGTGWGLKFDYIIIHESGHEWFANNITYQDMADMWIHEGFTCYSESLYLEYHFGKEAAEAYIRGIRRHIMNDSPMIGPYQVNQSGSSDVYFKGANVLHTLRQVVNDDQKWRNILREMNRKFYHQTVTTGQIEDFLSAEAGISLASFFDQYLRTTKIPTLEYYFTDQTLVYRWSNVVAGFNMQVKIKLDGQDKWLNPVMTWTHEYL